MLRSTLKIAVVGILVPAAVRAAPATTAPASATRPAETKVPIVLVEKPVHDFGEVWVGDLLHTFILRNVGEAPLRVTKVKPACGCTAAGKYPDVIQPSYSGEFPFKLSAERYNGPFSTTISVETDDPAHQETKLTLKGSVKHYVTVSPTSALFGSLRADSVETRKVTLTNNTETPMKPSVVTEPKSETFKGELVEVEAAKKYELVVTASPPYGPKYNRFLMQVDPGIPNAPTLKVLCTAYLPERLDLSRDAITPTGSMYPQRVQFTNNGDKPVKLLSATPLDPSIKVTTEVKEEAKTYDIVVSFPPNYQPPPGGTSIVLKTDDEEKPELRIAVRGSSPTPRVQPPTTARKPPVRRYPAMALEGKAAPKVALQTYDKKEVALGGSSDKVQLVMFYASWCGFCRKALPGVDKIYQDYKSKGVDVVAINIDSRTGGRAYTEEKTLGVYKSLNLNLPMVMDPEQQVAKQFNMPGTGVPAFFVVDKTGTVEAVHTGGVVVTDNTLVKELDLLREGKPLPKPEPVTPAPGS